ncbi:hypothetical protein JXQ31_18530 [candidate division KSB1 bacterium]|nr:hypothetical protein [candidate division KSB1 bacterium]
MTSLYNIWVVARYETKILFRSWFFRVLALIAIGILTFLNIIFFSGAVKDVPWVLRGVPSSIPYFNLMMLNTVQAVLTVFLASDFLKRDVKTNTTEVIYMRSMSNAEYVLGKTGGILNIFILLNLIILFIGAVINIAFSDIGFHFINYIVYFLLISIPTIIFITGFTYLIMIIIRNQPVTLVLMVGYISLSLIYLQHKANYIFDIVAFYLPLSYSDFVGFDQISIILLQRGMYLFIGLSFIFLTILFLKRLPQSKIMLRLAPVLSVIFMITAIYFCITSLGVYRSGQSLRTNMTALNDRYINEPAVSITDCTLDFEHLGDTFSCTANLKFTNRDSVPINSYIFSLNPGLQLDKVLQNQQQKEFERQYHIITIKPERPLNQGESDSLIFVYRGAPDDNACYLDIDEQKRSRSNYIVMYKAGKKFSFITPQYVLLTRENLWYPVPGVTHGSHLYTNIKKDFIRFKLNVKLKSDLQPVSQGSMDKMSDREFRFVPETPLPQISLIIGNYKKIFTTVDSIDYNLYTLPKHNFYSPYFTQIGDTLKSIISDAKREYETKLNLDYPFKRLSIIEVPVHYIAYDRLVSYHQENVQPALVLFPENGVSVQQVDFRAQIHRFERMERRMNQTIGEKEIQARLFNMFVNVFTGGVPMFNPNRNISVNLNIFPNYYTYKNVVYSRDWPVLNASLEAYLNSKLSESTPFFARNWQGILNEEKANLALKTSSLNEILSNPDNRDIVNDVLENKSEMLFKLLTYVLGDEQFNTYLTQYLDRNRFTSVDFLDFVSGVENKLNFNFYDFMQKWYGQIQMPGYYIANIQSYKVLDGNRTRYQIRFDVSNNEDIDGLITVNFRTRGGGVRGRFMGGGGARGESEPERIYYIQKMQTKQIGILLDSQPGAIMINSLVSLNLPSAIDRRFEEFDLNEKAVPFEGEKILEKPVMLSLPNEIIVDNEDEGFTVQAQDETSLLKKIFKMSNGDKEEYVGLNMWRVPNNWSKTIHSDFYGRYVHSAYYVKSGNGSKVVTWNANIPESGQYDVYCYANTIQFRGGPGRGRGRGRERQPMAGEMHYDVYHDDGQEEVTLDIQSAQEGWNFLGTYYLSAGTAQVRLSDKSNARMVVADAVKWVKH